VSQRASDYRDSAINRIELSQHHRNSRIADDEMCKISSKMDPFEDTIAKMSATSMTAFEQSR
jgi:hypothetical protein